MDAETDKWTESWIPISRHAEADGTKMVEVCDNLFWFLHHSQNPATKSQKHV